MLLKQSAALPHCLRYPEEHYQALHQLDYGSTVCEVSLSKLLDDHQALFKEGLGKIHPYKAKLQVRPDAQPKFFKPRSMLFAIKPAIEQELDCLEASGTMVSHAQ